MVIDKATRVLGYGLARLLGLEIRRVDRGTVRRSGRAWDYHLHRGFWVGGRFEAPNLSEGYHGILRQWWEHYNLGRSCLLVSENNVVKAAFERRYPAWRFRTLDYYDNKGKPVDIKANLCADLRGVVREQFDLVICQATLEHLYDPFRAMRNLLFMVSDGGVVVIHTHLPSFHYHPYPRDYVRFQPDWFEDIPGLIDGCELLELYTVGGHVFAAYRKVAAAGRGVTTAGATGH